MSDPQHPDVWPPRWDLPPAAESPVPPPVADPPATVTQPDTPAASAWTPAPAPTGPSAWNAAGPPAYQLPPDLAAPPTVITPLAPLPAAEPPRRPAPWLLVGAVTLAAVLGVATTLLVVKPWAPAADTGTTGTLAQPTSAAPTSAPPGYVTPSYTTAPTAGGVQLTAGDPGTSLAQQAAADQALVAQVPEGYWVPQLSSKRVGLVADGITYSEQTIWSDHESLRASYPGAALLWSGDYTTFKYQDFWVTIVPAASSSTPEGANSWCASYGFDADHCFAKRISSTTTYSTTTQNR